MLLYNFEGPSDLISHDTVTCQLTMASMLWDLLPYLLLMIDWSNKRVDYAWFWANQKLNKQQYELYCTRLPLYWANEETNCNLIFWNSVSQFYQWHICLIWILLHFYNITSADTFLLSLSLSRPYLYNKKTVFIITNPVLFLFCLVMCLWCRQFLFSTYNSFCLFLCKNYLKFFEFWHL